MKVKISTLLTFVCISALTINQPCSSGIVFGKEVGSDDNKENIPVKNNGNNSKEPAVVRGYNMPVWEKNPNNKESISKQIPRKPEDGAVHSQEIQGSHPSVSTPTLVFTFPLVPAALEEAPQSQIFYSPSPLVMHTGEVSAGPSVVHSFSFAGTVTTSLTTVQPGAPMPLQEKDTRTMARVEEERKEEKEKEKEPQIPFPLTSISAISDSETPSDCRFLIPRSLKTENVDNHKRIIVPDLCKIWIYQNRSSASHEDIPSLLSEKTFEDEEKLENAINWVKYFIKQRGKHNPAQVKILTALLDDNMTYDIIRPSFVRIVNVREKNYCKILITIPGGQVIYMKVPG